MPAKQKEFTFGTCYFNHLSPGTPAPTTRTLNVVVAFEDALKLNLAVSEALHEINRKNRAFKEGRDAGVKLTIHLDKNRVSVNRGKVKRK